MSQPALQLTNVSKLFTPFIIFKNLNLDLERGKIHLLLGKNGAGKTTLLKIMAGLSLPDSGEIKRTESEIIGFMGHSTFIYPDLSAYENLEFWAKAYKLDSKKLPYECLERVNLLQFAHEKSGTFSRGMSQRLNFARIIMLAPDILLLDEPFTGLDSQSRKMMINEILNLRSKNCAIILVTHTPHVDAEFSDHVFFLAGKTMEFSGSPEKYLEMFHHNQC